MKVIKVSTPILTQSLQMVAFVLLYITLSPSIVLSQELNVGSPPYITTEQELVILSANDGRALVHRDSLGLFDKEHIPVQDSYTVIRLGPNHPPRVKTVYGTAPSNIIGPPHLALSEDGHYGFIVNHSFMPPTLGQYWTMLDKLPENQADAMAVIDLSTDKVDVTSRLIFPTSPTLVLSHPDEEHFIVLGGTKIYTIAMEGSTPFIESTTNSNISMVSMAISPDGNTIVVTGQDTEDPSKSWMPYLFNYEDGKIEFIRSIGIQEGLNANFNGPFSPKFTPDGSSILFSNGYGLGSKGTLDDVLIADMTLEEPRITQIVPQLADGIESIAIHPSGNLAAIACLDALPPKNGSSSYSHLAVIDLTSDPAQLLYHLPIETFPEGIEFTPDGSKLFVGLTDAGHIAVFDVEGFMLKRVPYVIRTGHGPAVMGIGKSYDRSSDRQ